VKQCRGSRARSILTRDSMRGTQDPVP